jgi:thiamine-monophosphate kinase
MLEFEIINQFFVSQSVNRSDVIVGIGDDAAIVQPPPGRELVITTDTLIAGVHFPLSTSPYDIGYKALAVNLSDLAAMGATPAWATLTLSMPHADPVWLQAFCDGFFTLAHSHHVQLIGGDLTRGNLSITIQAIGFIPYHQAILRSGAQPTDLIFVTGTLGDAGLALRFIQNHRSIEKIYQAPLLEKLNRPTPRIEIGKQLRNHATAAIDVSDGLVADLQHILKQSKVGATLYVDQLPLSEALICTLAHEEAIALALTAGDDYELCFTIPASSRAELEKLFTDASCRMTCIGEIKQEPDLFLCHSDGSQFHGQIHGYQHF